MNAVDRGKIHGKYNIYFFVYPSTRELHIFATVTRRLLDKKMQKGNSLPPERLINVMFFCNPPLVQTHLTEN